MARKDGWRGDGYFGWAVTDGLVVEGWGSYGYLDNMILSNNVVGRTDSHRTMLGAKMIGDLPDVGATAGNASKILDVLALFPATRYALHGTLLENSD